MADFHCNMVTSIEAVIEFKRPLFYKWNRTLNNGGVSPVTKSTLLENGDFNKSSMAFQVECLQIGIV